MMQQLLKGVEPRYLTLGMGLLTFCTIMITIAYGVKPDYTSYVNNRDSLELLQNRMDDQLQLQRMIDTQKQDIASLQHDLYGESGALPINEMESYLIGRLQNLSWESDVQLVGVKPGSSKRVIEFDEISFDVDITGEYRNLYDWLNKLGKKLGFVMVTKFKIKAIGQKDKDNRLNMNMTLVFYRISR